MWGGVEGEGEGEVGPWCACTSVLHCTCPGVTLCKRVNALSLSLRTSVGVWKLVVLLFFFILQERKERRENKRLLACLIKSVGR